MKVAKAKSVIITVLLVVFFADFSHSENKRLPETELKKKADLSFAKQKYEEALPQYSQLLSVNPEDTKYIYRFGVCLLMAGKEKSNAATFLYLATKDPQAPSDVYYFLGRGYMINYDFSKALDAFNAFKKNYNGKNISTYDVEAYVRNCNNGIELLQKRKNVIIVGTKEVPLNSFYQNYDYTQSGGKIVNAPTQFLSQKDLSLQKDPVMYIADDKNTFYLSSYGKKNDNGKDIYIAHKTPSSDWSTPENISSVINTTSDEDFPFMASDGRTLYFSSKGHNSIGGYDIFKSVYDNTAKTWSEPENLGIPINTTSDDFLFVPGPDGLTACYSTKEESDNNSIILRKVRLENGSKNIITINGRYVPVDQKVRKDARISVLTSSGDGIITTTHTDSRTGNYKLIIPSGENYLILVEGGGYSPHLENFNVPADMPAANPRQVVQMDKQMQSEKMILQNFFSQGLEASIPTNTLSKSYSIKIDSSLLVKIKINDQIVYATQPATTGSNSLDNTGADDKVLISPVDSSALSDYEKKKSTLPIVKINRRDKYDPTLEKGISNGDIHQMEDEANRRQELKTEEQTPEIFFNDNISNEEIAKIAFADARDMQNEADSLDRLASNLRKEASTKLNLASDYKKQSEAPGLDADSISSLKDLSEQNKTEADLLIKEAESVSEQAAGKESEARLAYADANEISGITKVSDPLASNSKSISKTTRTNKKSNTNGVPSIQNNKKEAGNTSEQVSGNITNTDDKEAVANTKKLAPESNALETHSENSVSKTELQTDNLASAPADVPVVKSAPENSKPQVSGSVDTHSNNLIVEKTTISEKKDPSVPLKPADKNIAKQNVLLDKNVQAYSDGKTDSTKDKLKPEKVIPQAHANTAESLQKKENASQAVLTGSKDSLQTAGAGSELTEKNTFALNTIYSVKPAESNVAKSLNENRPEINNTKVEDIPQAGTGSKKLVPIRAGSTFNKKANEFAVNSSIGEAPREETGDAISANVLRSNSSVSVNEEAKTAYNEYQKRITNSNTLSAQSLQLQQEINSIPNSPYRDSLIRKSNELSLTSIKEWQQAQQNIRTARSIEPGIDYKMNSTAYIPEKNNSTTAQENYASVASKTNKENLNANTSGGLSAKESVAATPLNDAKADEKIFKYNSKPLNNNTESKKSENAAHAVDIKAISQPSPEPELANIDTTHPDFPKYIKLSNEIKNVQVETINIFASALNLNKKSAEEREKGLSLMDQAQSEKNEKKKKEFARKAEELNASAEKHDAESKKMLINTQENLQDVKFMNADLAALKQKISLVPDTDKSLASSQPSGPTKILKPEASITSGKLNEKEIDPLANSVDGKINPKNEKVVADKSAVSSTEKKPVPVSEPNKPVTEASVKESKASLPQKVISNIVTGSEKVTSISVNKSSPLITDSKSQYTKKQDSSVVDVNREIKTNGLNPENPIAKVDENKVANTPTVKNLDKSFNKTEDVPDAFHVSEEDIASASVSKSETDDFLNKVFSVNQVSSEKSGKKIPMDPELPEGLVFKVQISAVQKPITNNSFNGLKPLTGESTRQGWIRYCVGLFRTFEPANMVKKEVQKIGYKDAFVVAYYNGKRIELNESYNLIRKKQNLTAYKDQSAKEISMLESANIFPNRNVTNIVDKDEVAFFGKQPIPDVPVAVSPVEYSVQVGVYSRSKAPDAIAALSDLKVEQINEKLFRFSSGRFSDFQSADEAKKKIMEAGVKDAFVIVYRNGNYEVAKDVSAPTASLAPIKSLVSASGILKIQPVEKTPNLVYKVQIGAYKKNVPFNMIESYVAINDKGITTLTDDRDLHIFYVGNFNDFSNADAMRLEVISKGVKDAFVVALRNGKRVPISDEMKK